MFCDRQSTHYTYFCHSSVMDLHIFLCMLTFNELQEQHNVAHVTGTVIQREKNMRRDSPIFQHVCTLMKDQFCLHSCLEIHSSTKEMPL